MPTLVNPDHIQALQDKVATMSGSPREITAALNKPEVTGYETGELGTDPILETLSPDTVDAIDAESLSDSAEAADALWLITAIADMDTISFAQGETGRETLEILEGANVIPTAERDALISAAEEPVTGASWGEQARIGQIHQSWVEDALEAIS